MTEPQIRVIEVVIADDDPGTVRWLNLLIERHWGDKVRVKGFLDPVEACLWLDYNPCEILVTDLQMPAINGLALARHARIKSPLIQVIFISAEPSVDTVLQAAQDGASDFLLKPVDAAEMIDRLDKAEARFTHWQGTMADTLCRTLPTSEEHLFRKNDPVSQAMKHTRTIVLMDNDAVFAQAVAEYLTNCGYVVVAVGNPAALIAELRSSRHRLVLLDVDFPGTDGLNLLRVIRRNNSCTHVIALTRTPAMTTLSGAIQDGAEACFLKPMATMKPLLAAVEDGFRKIDRWWDCLRDLTRRKHAGVAVSATSGWPGEQ